ARTSDAPRPLQQIKKADLLLYGVAIFSTRNYTTGQEAAEERTILLRRCARRPIPAQGWRVDEDRCKHARFLRSLGEAVHRALLDDTTSGSEQHLFFVKQKPHLSRKDHEVVEGP